MDHLTFAQLLGSYGEFIGAIAVVATLFYLAVQVRHSKEATEANTRSLEENRRLAVAQTYQARADAFQSMLTSMGASNLGSITEKLIEAGWPDSESAIESLSIAERSSLISFESARLSGVDNLHYQHEQGYLDDEGYNARFEYLVRGFTPLWKSLGLLSGYGRASFLAEVDRIMAKDDSET
jgi:hypothetical protein